MPRLGRTGPSERAFCRLRPGSGSEPEPVSAPQVLPGRQCSPPRGSELIGRRGARVSPLPPGPADGTASEAPPGPRGPSHGPWRGLAARREAWLRGRPLAAPQPGLPGRHEDGRGGTSAARGAVACVALGTKMLRFLQIEGKTLHQQKDYDLLYCGCLERNLQYL